jgi:hypothetical protein
VPDGLEGDENGAPDREGRNGPPGGDDIAPGRALGAVTRLARRSVIGICPSQSASRSNPDGPGRLHDLVPAR